MPELAEALGTESPVPFLRQDSRLRHDTSVSLLVGNAIRFHHGKLVGTGKFGMFSKREKIGPQVVGPKKRAGASDAPVNESILRLARLIGRQMAREAFEQKERKQCPGAKDGSS